jgi:hypothetical protein
MISLEDIRNYLPSFLSQGSEQAFLEEIRVFLSQNSKQPFYTSALSRETILFQGDGLEGMLVINLPDVTIKRAPAMLLSNTCDVHSDNKRLFSSCLTYAPIFSLDKYLYTLRTHYDDARVKAHEDAIRNQLITQIFFLPNGARLGGDCLVFLDRAMSASSGSVNREKLSDLRLFTLSDFGAWLFALKLSIHFCRIRDRVDRTAGVVNS